MLHFESLLEMTTKINEPLVAKFCAEVTKDPQHAMEWSEGFFSVAAKLHVARTVERGIAAIRKANVNTSDEGIVAHMCNYAREQAMRGALYPARSTSTASNLAKQCETAAWAELAEALAGNR